MKRFWVKMVLLALCLSLAGGIIIFAISGRFQLSSGAAIGYFIGLFGLVVIQVLLWKK